LSDLTDLGLASPSITQVTRAQTFWTAIWSLS